MTLTTRLSVFFLAALGVILLGFSAALYLCARTYLYRQAEDRLDSVLSTLTAAAEIGRDGIEWEPHERHLSLGPVGGTDQVHWLVQDDQGHRIDSSPAEPRPFLVDFLPAASAEPDRQVIDRDGDAWLVAQRRLQAGSRGAEVVPGKSPTADRSPEPKYAVLVITGGVSLAPVRAMTRSVALALTGTSSVLWLLAASSEGCCVAGPWRRSHMATTARRLSATTLDQRLPLSGTGDEVEDLGRAFNDLLSRLQESFERQRRFTGDASHQLRTPLAAMLGQLEVTLRRDRPSEEYRQVLTRVQGQADHLRQIVEALLFLARADADSRLSSLEAIDLAVYLPQHLQSWSGHARWADMRIEGGSGNEYWVHAHAALLGQLVDNLLDNACKYSEPGTPITLRLTKEAGVVGLTVADGGRGIPPEDLPHIFEPFYRSAQARRLGLAGVGLGLAVAQRIAAALNGGLRVESNVGQGSRFLLWLPQAASCDADCYGAPSR